MHRSQTLSAFTGAGRGVLAEDVAAICPTALVASISTTRIVKSLRAISFLIAMKFFLI